MDQTDRADADHVGQTGSGKELRSGEGRGLNLDVFSVFEQHPKPVIAAINVAAVGGCGIALSCDIRVMARDATIGTPEIKFGALPAGGGTQRLARFVGVGKAKEMIMTGEPVTADEALRIGLVNSVVPGEALMEAGAASRASSCGLRRSRLRRPSG